MVPIILPGQTCIIAITNRLHIVVHPNINLKSLIRRKTIMIGGRTVIARSLATVRINLEIFVLHYKFYTVFLQSAHKNTESHDTTKILTLQIFRLRYVATIANKRS